MKYKLLGTLRRIAILLLVAWTVVSLVTLLIELVPGDPAMAILGEQATPAQIEQFRQKHGLDRPAFFFSYSSEPDGQRALRAVVGGVACRENSMQYDVRNNCILADRFKTADHVGVVDEFLRCHVITTLEEPPPGGPSLPSVILQ